MCKMNYDIITLAAAGAFGVSPEHVTIKQRYAIKQRFHIALYGTQPTEEDMGRQAKKRGDPQQRDGNVI